MRSPPPLALAPAGPLLCLLLLFLGLLPAASASSAASYGVDVSFPVHHVNFRLDDASSPFGDGPRRSYESFVAGCKTLYYDGCVYAERDRVDMALREPALMQNYTDTGYKVAPIPPDVYTLLKDFYDANRADRTVENNGGNLFVNHWSSPTYLIDVESPAARSLRLKRRVWDGVKPVLEEWAGVELSPAFMYGIRDYTSGAILSPHVDRRPFIISVIVNVDQDVDEDWPLEVYGRDGMAYNVTTVPGEMVLYESHSLIHGRPFPLRGRSFANLLINFTPTGKVLRKQDASSPAVGGKEHSGGSPGKGKALRAPPRPATRTREAPVADAAPRGSLARAAAAGDVDRMRRFAEDHPYLLHNKDARGWQALHEAARGGHVDVVRLLVAHGADVNERTDFGKGWSPLALVREHHGEGHLLFGYLEGLGAEL